jgi:hypothetical protein
MAIIPNDEKVFMVSNTTNTTYSGSQAMKDMNEWYTMEDVKNTVIPYKVYTALLTQSGADDPSDLNTGSLIIGVTYRIIDTSPGMDFTNVGASNNNVGTSFVATGTTPNSWGENEGLTLILRYNNGSPRVVSVLENNIGNIWFDYCATGVYFIYSDSLFSSDKTFIIGSMWGDDNVSPRFFGGYYSDESNLIFGNGSGNDNLQIYLEIRVYN